MTMGLGDPRRGTGKCGEMMQGHRRCNEARTLDTLPPTLVVAPAQGLGLKAPKVKVETEWQNQAQ